MEKNSINSTKKTLLYSEFQNKKLKTYILVLNGGASISLTNMWDIRLGRGDASILIYIVKEDRAVATKIWGFRAATLINVIVEFPHTACGTLNSRKSPLKQGGNTRGLTRAETMLVGVAERVSVVQSFL